MTYLEKIQSDNDWFNPESLIALICCGTDLHHPYEGWAGVVAVPLYKQSSMFKLYFNGFDDALQEYENVPTYKIDNNMNKLDAFRALTSWVKNVCDNERVTFISSNASTWASDIILSAMNETGNIYKWWSTVDLRVLYAVIKQRKKLQSAFDFGSILTMTDYKGLPKRFGLYAMAEEQLGDYQKTIPSCDKPEERLRLTADISRSLLATEYVEDD